MKASSASTKALRLFLGSLIFGNTFSWKIRNVGEASSQLPTRHLHRRSLRPPRHRLSSGREVNAFHKSTLGVCEEGCTSDSDCEEGLTCLLDNSTHPVLGCEGVGSRYCYNSSQLVTSSPESAEESLSFIMQFSVSLPDDSLTADDFLFGKAAVLMAAVLNSTLEILCVQTDFIVSGSIESEDSDYCSDQRVFVGDIDLASIVSKETRFRINDASSGELQWTHWGLKFPVLQVGQVYLQSAADESDLSQDAALIRQEGTKIMERVAQNALSSSIRSGQFDSMIGNEMRTSEAGKEVDTFTVESQVGETQEEGDEPTVQDDIDPEPLHTLRIAGIALFLVNVTVLFLTCRLSSRRSRQRQLEDEEDKAEVVGRLTSEKDVTMMLEAGRLKAQEVAFNESSEESS